MSGCMGLPDYFLAEFGVRMLHNCRLYMHMAEDGFQLSPITSFSFWNWLAMELTAPFHQSTISSSDVSYQTSSTGTTRCPQVSLESTSIALKKDRQSSKREMGPPHHPPSSHE